MSLKNNLKKISYPVLSSHDRLKPHRQIILLLILFLFTRLPFIDSDFHVLEPDEGLFYGLMKEFQSGQWPIFGGHKFLETFPLFVYIASKLDIITSSWGMFAAQRMLSVAGALLLGYTFYQYWKYISKSSIAIIPSLLIWTVPLFYFYSLSGTMDVLYISLATSSLLLLFLNLSKKIGNPRISGALLAFSILIKFSACIYVPTFLLLYLLTPKKYIIWKEFTQTFLGVIALFLVPYYLYFGAEFIRQAALYPDRHLLPLNITVHIATLKVYLQKTPWWISWPFSIFSLISVLWLAVTIPLRHTLKTIAINASAILTNLFIRCAKRGADLAALQDMDLSKEKTIALHGLLLIIPGILFLVLFDMSPRYYLLVVPGLVFLATAVINKIGIKYGIILWLSILPSTYYAWQATQHMELRFLMHGVTDLSSRYSSLTLYSTVDAEKMGYFFNKPVELLSSKAKDGGIIIVDKRKTELYAQFSEPEYKDMVKMLESLCDKKIVYRYTDPLNHFPVSNLDNEFRVYLVTGASDMDADCALPY